MEQNVETLHHDDAAVGLSVPSMQADVDEAEARVKCAELQRRFRRVRCEPGLRMVSRYFFRQSDR